MAFKNCDMDIVHEFFYLTVCMEGKHIFNCLDGYTRRKGSGIKDNMGCYFACELDSQDPDRIENTVLIYHEDSDGNVNKIHISENQFYSVLEEALNKASFLFNEEEWFLVQCKLAELKSTFCTE